MECLVSVIIPVYNAEKYIWETLHSILDQETRQIEVIAVDDGSKDQSLQLCREIQDSRLRVLSQQNQGAPAARNHGLSHARGKYVLFFDADDIMCDHLFEQILPLLAGDSPDCVVGNYYRMKGEQMDQAAIEYAALGKMGGVYDTYMMSPYPCCKLYKKALIDRYHLQFDAVRLAQDLNFYLKFIGIAGDIYFTDIPFCYYRYVDNSISHVIDDRILDIGKSIDLCADFYKANQLDRTRLKWVYVNGLKHVNYQMEKIVKVQDAGLAQTLYQEMRAIWKKMYAESGIVFHGGFFYKKAIVTLIQIIYRRNIRKHLRALKRSEGSSL